MHEIFTSVREPQFFFSEFSERFFRNNKIQIFFQSFYSHKDSEKIIQRKIQRKPENTVGLLR
jgi:hypothetical protein